MPWAKDKPMEEIRAYGRMNMARYRANHPEYEKREKEHRNQVKLEVLTHYSGGKFPVCADPFGIHAQNRDEPLFTDVDCLTIDHIKGGGNKHRRKIKERGVRFYYWLKKHNYPKGYQCLCMNCQFKKESLKART